MSGFSFSLGEKQDSYEAQVRQVLEKLVQENPPNSGFVRPSATEDGFSAAPFFTVNKDHTLFAKLKGIAEKKLQESGWSDQLVRECSHRLRSKGLNQIPPTQVLCKEMTPFALETFPSPLKNEIIELLKDALLKELEDTELQP